MVFVVDGGRENFGEVLILVRKYNIGRVKISAYYTMAAGIIKQGYKALMDFFFKFGLGGNHWVTLLPIALLANRTTIHAPTGFTPFFYIYGREAILPIEICFTSWRILNWHWIHTREELLTEYIWHLQLKNENIKKTRFKKACRKKEGKEAFNKAYHIRTEPLKTGNVILRFNNQLHINKSGDRKLEYHWYGPFLITKASKKRYYKLKELDGTLLHNTVAGKWLKKFV